MRNTTPRPAGRQRLHPGSFTVPHPIFLSVAGWLLAVACVLPAQAQDHDHDHDTPVPMEAALESPADGATVSGLGFISGWKCHAGEITVVIDDGEPIMVVTGLTRADTAGSCHDEADNGFIIQTNWNWLSAGEHTAVAYDDGEEFARHTFTVGTTGEEFLEDVMGECAIADFPMPGEQATFVWNESTQHLELSEVMATEEDDDHGHDHGHDHD